jgi:hypothetical protein
LGERVLDDSFSLKIIVLYTRNSNKLFIGIVMGFFKLFGKMQASNLLEWELYLDLMESVDRVS